VSAAPGIVEDATGFCSDTAPLPIVGRRTDAAPPSWIIIATAEMDVNADPPPERAAMVRAGRVERGIALARCCDWPVLWQRWLSIGTV